MHIYACDCVHTDRHKKECVHACECDTRLYTNFLASSAPLLITPSSQDALRAP